MRLLALTLALAALPAFAQTQIAPGVQLSRPGENMPGMVQPGAMPGMVPPGMVDPASALGGPLPGLTPAESTIGPAPATSSSGPKTASEQGLVDRSGEEEARRMLEDARARSSARQRGIVVHVPTLATPVSADPASREWLHNWEFSLQALGVSKEKVRFEASRLSRSDFEAWASRQFRFRQADHARVQVLDRQSVCEAGEGC